MPEPDFRVFTFIFFVGYQNSFDEPISSIGVPVKAFVVSATAMLMPLDKRDIFDEFYLKNDIVRSNS